MIFVTGDTHIQVDIDRLSTIMSINKLATSSFAFIKR